MKEYIVIAVIMALASAVLGELSHPSFSKDGGIALGAVAVIFIVAPIVQLVSEGISHPPPEISLPAIGGIEEIAEDAYISGVRDELAQRYSLSAEDISVSCRGFRVEDLSCEELTVVLRRSAALSDHRAMREYLKENLKIGECDVRIEGDKVFFGG